MMSKFLATLGWFANEYIRGYRDNASRIYELSIKTTALINQIILTVSVASLAAIAALGKAVFMPYGPIAFTAILLFVFTILISVINLYLSLATLADIRKKLDRNIASPTRFKKLVETSKFMKAHKILSVTVLTGFCLGLIALLVLLGFYILEAK